MRPVHASLGGILAAGAVAAIFAGCGKAPGEASGTKESTEAAPAKAAPAAAAVEPATPAAPKVAGVPAAKAVEPPAPPPPPPPPAPKKVVKPVIAGTGYSVLKDPEEAGKEAAGKARAALGGEAAKLVIVFSFAKKFDHAKALEGVCSVFDPSLVCGCSAYNAITQEGNNGMLGVLAMGGGIKVTTTLGNVEGNDYEGCGRQIGEALGKALEEATHADAPGKLVVLFGDCHVNKNDSVVKGICSVLGERFPVVGAAAMGDVSFDKGKVVGKKKNVGILITGDFEIGCSTLNEGPPDVDPNKLVAAAGQAFKNAVGDDLDRTALVFAFDCGGRRGKMGKDRPRELGVMQAVVGIEMPIFGFYGSGEMGPKKTGDVPRGVGYHISACAIKRK